MILFFRFDSDILEGQYQRSSLPTLTLRFQYALIYIFVSSVTWAIYWAVIRTSHWPFCLAVALILAVASVSQLIYTRSKSYKVSTRSKYIWIHPSLAMSYKCVLEKLSTLWNITANPIFQLTPIIWLQMHSYRKNLASRHTKNKLNVENLFLNIFDKNLVIFW